MLVCVQPKYLHTYTKGQELSADFSLEASSVVRRQKNPDQAGRRLTEYISLLENTLRPTEFIHFHFLPSLFLKNMRGLDALFQVPEDVVSLFTLTDKL